MIESKFSTWVILPASISIFLLSITFFFLFRNDEVFNPDTPLIFRLIFSAFFIYFSLFIIWGELRTKAIKIYIKDGTITKKGFLGLGLKTTYDFTNIDGYKISFLLSRGGAYEYLYLIIGNKKVIKVSEYYHGNYNALKLTLIKQGIKNLGFEQWSFLTETKEMFS